MCGIFCAVSRMGHVWPSDTTQELLRARGPDAVGRLALTYSDGRDDADKSSPSATVYLSCYSTVLALRGPVIVKQPYQTEDSESTLCWNGEAWSIHSIPTTGNDTVAIHELLQAALDDANSLKKHDATEQGNRVAEALSKVAGPYAFIFFDAVHGKIYYGRDFLGRRSLLRSTSDDGKTLVLSSVVGQELGKTWLEVEADGIYCVDLVQLPTSSEHEDGCADNWIARCTTRIPYITSANISQQDAASVIPTLSLNRQISRSGSPLDPNSSSVIRLEMLLRESLMLRILNIPKPVHSSNHIEKRISSSLAVLFSGGLDCTVLARISHELLPVSEPIDLLNVAFENPRVHKVAAGETPERQYFEVCPDRITGWASYNELCRVCPQREWRFITVNIPYSDTQNHRQEVVRLMHPHNTEMDLSIALALYFAARGSGTMLSTTDGTDESYATSARVLLSGLGADELFGGYTRHISAFKRSGLVGLLDELCLDIGRLGKRNLGRDDRVMSNWAREARFPYLDERLVSWALSIPINEKCGFAETEEPTPKAPGSSTPLEPGKKLLRCLALRLGMPNVAQEKKRAVCFPCPLCANLATHVAQIQFGARTAKMETGKTKGTHVLPSQF